MRPSDFSMIHLENEFSFMCDMPGLPVSQALLSISLLTTSRMKYPLEY